MTLGEGEEAIWQSIEKELGDIDTEPELFMPLTIFFSGHPETTDDIRISVEAMYQGGGLKREDYLKALSFCDTLEQAPNATEIIQGLPAQPIMDVTAVILEFPGKAE